MLIRANQAWPSSKRDRAVVVRTVFAVAREILTPVEGEVLRLYYGLDGGGFRSFAEVAKEMPFAYTGSSASYAHARAERKIAEFVYRSPWTALEKVAKENWVPLPLFSESAEGREFSGRLPLYAVHPYHPTRSIPDAHPAALEQLLVQMMDPED